MNYFTVINAESKELINKRLCEVEDKKDVVQKCAELKAMHESQQEVVAFQEVYLDGAHVIKEGDNITLLENTLAVNVSTGVNAVLIKNTLRKATNVKDMSIELDGLYTVPRYKCFKALIGSEFSIASASPKEAPKETNHIESSDYRTFRQILENMADVYEAKNSDYGSAVEIQMAEKGLTYIDAILGNKTLRFSQLAQANYIPKVDEKIEDTLLDIAVYCIEAVRVLEKHKAGAPLAERKKVLK